MIKRVDDNFTQVYAQKMFGISLKITLETLDFISDEPRAHSHFGTSTKSKQTIARMALNFFNQKSAKFGA